MIIIVLLIIAAVSNALMDLSSEGKFNGYWDKATGSKNKYKLGKKENGPAFPGSTTIFVWTTDGWHFFQFMFHTSWQLAIAIQFDNWIYKFVLIKILFSLIFELVYSHIKKINQ